MDLNDLSTRGLIKLVLNSVTRQEAFLSELSASFGRLSTAVEGMRSDYESRMAAVQESLEAERAEADRLAQAEAVEDVTQDQALADARATSDTAIADAQAVAEQMDALASQLSQAQSADPGSVGGDTPTPDAPEAPDGPAVPPGQDPGVADDAGPAPTPVDESALPATDGGDPGVPVAGGQDVTATDAGPGGEQPQQQG